MSPKAMGGPNDPVPKAETAVLSMEEQQVGDPGEEPVSLIPGAKGVTEKEEVAGTPGWQETKKARKETAVYVSGQTADPTLCSKIALLPHHRDLAEGTDT
ncbi:hypothetical protein MG293_002379 [Ovis ammon polii]|uniref:Uncharacterized protein n=1 Tax=Ovis ammon polii TaxID=230172 RepID=A0AAD4UL75_OVIAM|nr:hypothetical protein MG293_002379 [Ovis ammon polii]